MVRKAQLVHGVPAALGYHSKVDERTPLAYTRDSMAGPVRELEQVIREIHRGSFLPGATRSGYLRAAPSDLAEGESDSEDSADEEDDAVDQRAAEQCLRLWPNRGVSTV